MDKILRQLTCATIAYADACTYTAATPFRVCSAALTAVIPRAQDRKRALKSV